ncbi:hypothetical protein T4D_6456 [Trichinella pseudospiralis]|uniref:Uncharacterized protein n=1 Tax=Trichinella pseudospiralis TaxID=6337 RepID=A0A0V1DKJ2_TRIPS|nr:hypothetical protein T4D_6456 [Trichinella pseudospiralis]
MLAFTFFFISEEIGCQERKKFFSKISKFSELQTSLFCVKWRKAFFHNLDFL